MSGQPWSENESLPLTMAQRLDDVCWRFEKAWKNGERPRIEDFLGETAEPERSALVPELIRLDIEYRRHSSENPLPEDYQDRFPYLDPQWIARRVAGPAPSKASSTLHPSRLCSTHCLTYEDRHIRCPTCHNPIQLSDDQSEEVLCPGCGSSFRVRDAQQTTTTGGMRPLGKFELLERVGLGAFGAVWRARDTELDRIVALKIPHTGLLTAQTDLERFHREARSAAQLRHPGIVTVHEVVTLEGLPTIVSDFVAGVPLKDLLEIRPFTFSETAKFMAAVAEAVDYAHSLGVVHRDLKPANIMVEFPRPDFSEAGQAGGARNKTVGMGRPRVMDFGLARREEAELTMTMDGHILGTPAYMSPEQAAGLSHRADRRSDVYSLGVILYQLLCAELPFRGSRNMILHQVLHEEPRPLRKINDKIPSDLETICLKCLQKEAHQRYANAQALKEDLENWLAGRPIQARPVGATEWLWRWCRRNPAWAAALTALVVVTAAAAIGLALWTNAERGRRWERDANLARLGQTVETAEQLALAEVHSGRFERARDIAEEAAGRLTGVPEMAERHTRLKALRDRAEFLKVFYRSLDETELLANRMDRDGEAQVAARQSLESLGVFTKSEWWKHLPDEDLTVAQQKQLRENIYREILLLAGLHLKGAAWNFPSLKAADALRTALETLKPARRFQPSYAVETLEAICRAGLFQPFVPSERELVTATDFYLSGIAHLWFSGVSDPGILAFSFLLGKLPGLDMKNPLAKAEQHLFMAARLDPQYFWTHCWLGRVLRRAKKPQEAELAFNSCLGLRPNYGLGYVLRGGAILAQVPRAADPQAAEALLARGLVDLEEGVRLDPQNRTQNRYNAACAAALVGSGEDIDARLVGSTERTHWREHALHWLRNDLAVWTNRVKIAELKEIQAAREKLQHWQRDADLAGVRDQAALARLPRAEREAWEGLWADVDALLKR